MIRTRRGLKWGIPAMLLAAPYLLATNYCLTLIEDGGPGWLNLVVLLFCWSALKFVVVGPISLALLIRARIHEGMAFPRLRPAGAPGNAPNDSQQRRSDGAADDRRTGRHERPSPCRSAPLAHRHLAVAVYSSEPVDIDKVGTYDY